MWLSGPSISAYVPMVFKDSELLVIPPNLGWFRNRNPWKYFIFKVRQCHRSRRGCLLLFSLNTFQVWIGTGHLIDMWCLKWNSHCCILYFISVMEGVYNSGSYMLQTVCTKCWFSTFWSIVLFSFLFEIENRPQWLDQNSNYHVRVFFQCSEMSEIWPLRLLNLTLLLLSIH